jgi:hypothetical protein
LTAKTNNLNLSGYHPNLDLNTGVNISYYYSDYSSSSSSSSRSSSSKISSFRRFVASLSEFSDGYLARKDKQSAMAQLGTYQKKLKGTIKKKLRVVECYSRDLQYAPFEYKLQMIIIIIIISRSSSSTSSPYSISRSRSSHRYYPFTHRLLTRCSHSIRSLCTAKEERCYLRNTLLNTSAGSEYI